MNAFIKALPAIALFSLPIATFAQSSDADYCKALVAKYEQYLDMDSKRGQQPISLDVRTGVEKCKAGDPAGIPGDVAGFMALKNAAPPGFAAVELIDTV